jgi:hypothetical protein
MTATLCLAVLLALALQRATEGNALFFLGLSAPCVATALRTLSPYIHKFHYYTENNSFYFLMTTFHTFV